MGAIAAIFRIQHTYNITAHTFVNGKLPGCPAPSKLTADDCFELGTAAYGGEQYARAREWLEEADRILKEEHQETATSRIEVLEYLSWLQYATGDTKAALNSSLELLRIDPRHKSVRESIEHYSKAVKHGEPELSYPQIKANEQRLNIEYFVNSDYSKLCRGEPIKVMSAKSYHCWYDNRGDARLLLKPNKVEQVNDDPRVVIFRGLVTDRETARIKQIASPMLNRATVYNIDTGVLEYADYRVSKSAWLEDHLDETIATVNKRIAMVTGLDVQTAEKLQIANYGMGGQYEQHTDHGEPDSPLANDPLGNRIATLLIYLNDVALGGATVFLKAGVHVPPTKGDAVFWYNLKKSGDGDPLTEHAACPVVCGSKWVANKWFRANGNIFNRPCSTKRDL
ncbi:prolyl 4-hydroxylase subunit alpha-1 isoform X4 [Nematostella vectensis]|nr:prolyl 4-hydroxylase subunit alpha-1 isoform X4 [Nematostella vectensis]